VDVRQEGPEAGIVDPQRRALAEIGRIFDILSRHRIQSRSHMTMVNLALMTAEGMGKRLAPGLSLTDAALPYLAEALGRARTAMPRRPSRAAGGREGSAQRL
jgi:predicted unusual protein kinase regulating ubiquinone biosynthesis (AarF/ABC1/UbiB family)